MKIYILKQIIMEFLFQKCVFSSDFMPIAPMGWCPTGKNANLEKDQFICSAPSMEKHQNYREKKYYKWLSI